jgi:hypothetical protein
MRLTTSALAVLLAACTSATTRETVRPTENVVTEEQGELAAAYQLGSDVEQFGEAKVWSMGAYEAKVGGQERTVIRVGFEIDNTSNEAISFNPTNTKIATLKVDGGEISDLPVAKTQGRYLIHPRSTGRIDAYFVLPEGVQPQNVDSFTLFWSVAAGGAAYSEFTPFEEDTDYGYYADRPFYGPYPYAYDPFYDPLYYDPWYWHYHYPVVVQQPGVVVREHPGQVHQEVRAPSAAPPVDRAITPRAPAPAPAPAPRAPSPNIRVH